LNTGAVKFKSFMVPAEAPKGIEQQRGEIEDVPRARAEAEGEADIGQQSGSIESLD
jgi:hypothetical protein